MKYYFYIDNGIKNGPFNFDELREKRILKETLIWTDNLKDWVKAESLDELQNILITPPPLTPIEIVTHEKREKNANFALNFQNQILPSLIITFFISIIFVWFLHQQIVNNEIESGAYPIYLSPSQKSNPIGMAIYLSLMPALIVFIITYLLRVSFIRYKESDDENIKKTKNEILDIGSKGGFLSNQEFIENTVNRYTLDNEEIKIVSLNNETIGAKVYLNEDFAPDGTYIYLIKTKKIKLIVEKGTIVNCFFIFENKKFNIEQKSDSEIQKGDKVFLKNGEPAPSGKYNMGIFAFDFNVENGVIVD